MADLFRTHLGDTPIAEEEKMGLIPSLATQGELNDFEYANILSATRWAYQPRRLAKAEILNASYLLDLHRRMFNGTWRWAGQFRLTEKTIGVPPAEIQSQLAVLLGDVRYWVEHDTYSLDETILRFHHRLVLIHLFANGNGRHARLVANLLARQRGLSAFPWGAGTANATIVRQAYLAALRLADSNNYRDLISFARSGNI